MQLLAFAGRVKCPFKTKAKPLKGAKEKYTPYPPAVTTQ
jgi:hypothetical protein